MSNIGGNYFRLGPLTESRALWEAGAPASAVPVDGVEIGPESGGAREEASAAITPCRGSGGLP
jgi:hypothetical protein